MKVLLTFPNVTQAIWAEKLFRDNKMAIRVIPLPTSLGDFCGIALQIQTDVVVKAKQILHEAGVVLEAIFQMEEKEEGTRYTKWEIS
ncbi:DUF3343 domain-containing protein [Listeria sp. PSOL-1]|uniref:DUF3343 domain-containing protein n=1 Tax=Listeria sp. PSOL-1 TaxID=1844999 RepID=UPI0013D5B094|nr:DUF3343 domain-containing protein [Listeria sp. PSOL-1]